MMAGGDDKRRNRSPVYKPSPLCHLNPSAAACPRIRERKMPGPLARLRVLELARVLAGPWAGQTLADLGASVIKVERPQGGDDTRTWGPPFIADGDGPGSAAYFHATNRGKKSVAIDFETPDGRDAAVRLATLADVIIENFKVGGLAKYGLDYGAIKSANP